MKKNFFLTILASNFFIAIAFANDTTAAVSAGGIEFTKNNAIQMQSEALTISPGRVNVAYLFRNISNASITTTVSFPLPPDNNFGDDALENWDDEIVPANAHPPFRDFMVQIDGKTVAYNIKRLALLNGKNIAPTLEKEGIPLQPNFLKYVDDKNCNIEDKYYDGHNQPRNISVAECKKWFEKAKALGFLGKDNRPLWQKQVIYYWTQTFPAQKTVSVIHNYTPQTGSGAGLPIPKNLKQFYNYALYKPWAQKNDNRKEHYKETTQWDINWFQNVQYILTTGANWSGPIQQFKLTLQYDPEQIVLFNRFYGNSKPKITQTRGNTEIELTNFTPKQDLNIFFTND